MPKSIIYKLVSHQSIQYFIDLLLHHRGQLEPQGNTACSMGAWRMQLACIRHEW